MSIDAPVQEIITTPEKESSARRIYKGLQDNVGKATLFGYHGGNVYLDAAPGRQRKLQFGRIHTNFEPARASAEYRKRGFSDKDIASGIIVVHELEASDSEPIPSVVNESPYEKRTLFISGTGKVLERKPGTGRYDAFSSTKLDGYIRDAIERLAFLSSVPNIILDNFGSYDKFKEALGSVDMSGIETKDDSMKQVVYYSGPEGRLKEYIERIALIRKGQLAQTEGPFGMIGERDVELGDFKTFFDTLEKSGHISSGEQSGFQKLVHRVKSIVAHKR